MKRFHLFFLTVLALIFNTELFAAAEIQNLSISPATLAPGSVITVTFQMRSTTNQTGRFAISFSDSTSVNRCEQDWLTGDAIYNRTGQTSVTYWVNGVSQTAAGAGYASDGPSTGIVGNSTNVFQTVSVITAVPPEKAGNYYIVVGVRDNDALSYSCAGNQGPNAWANTPVTVSGPTTAYKLNLTAYGSSSSDRISIRFRIHNWSESTIRGKNLVVRYYMNHSTQSTGWTYNNANWTFNQAGGANDGTNNQMATEFVNTASSDCPDTGVYTRMANMYARMYYTANNKIVPPNGGYFNMSQNEELVHSSAPMPDATDDYSRAMDNASLAENKYLALFYNASTPDNENNDVHLCEYTSPSTIDALSGEQPCGISSCTRINMDKSAYPMDAYVGDTITYCITYTNNTGASQTFNIWDTVPAIMTYSGCSGCSVNYYGDTSVVYWVFNDLASGTSGTLCFWVVVARYPYGNKQELMAYLKEKYSFRRPVFN